MRKQSNGRRKSPNYLPTHLAKSYESSLKKLIASLSVDEYGFKGEYLKAEFLSKFMSEDTDPPEERRTRAIDKWLGQEAANAKSNIRLYGECHFSTRWSTFSSDCIVDRARGYIDDLLGPLDIELLLSSSTHTNGASTRVKRSPLAAFEKHSGIAHVTPEAYPYWLIMSRDTIIDQPVSFVRGSELFTVPKKTDIDRVACKEPEINMFLQKTVGNHIRRKLRRVGINLNDQSKNQWLAAIAVTKGLATVDLSAASDSISTTLVERLLPPEWFYILDDMRVKHTNIDGEEHHLSMFSSMGNGFTFELESLIFWALCRAIQFELRIKGTISVYGDDIIISNDVVPFLTVVFHWFGFKVNTKKSHWRGHFRESCGKHYHRSLDVTPFYLREPIRDKTDVIRTLNQLLEWDSNGLGCFFSEELAWFHWSWARIIQSDLWGGQDTSSILSLVTGDKPRRELVRQQIPIHPAEDDGSLCYWLNQRNAFPHPRWDEPLTCDRFRDGRFFTRPNRSPVNSICDPYLLWVS